MSYSAPLELITDATGSVTFGWIDERVYYARFSHSLSARLGEAFAGRLRAVASSCCSLDYFADARALESYDLWARKAFVRVVLELRPKFESLTILGWLGAELSASLLVRLGGNVCVAKDAADFEARLVAAAPLAHHKVGPKRAVSPRSRWSLRR